MHRRLAAVGITTREACGNTVRNVTACPQAGVCRTEAFDVAPYAHALTFFLLGHDDTQDFGRKFKVAFSGCKDERLRPDELPRPRRHRAHARGRRQDRARLRAGRGRRAGRGAAERAGVRRVPARRGAAADRAGDEPRVRAPRRASEPRPRPLQVRGQEARASRRRSGWCWRSAPSCARIRAGPRSSPTCTAPTRSRCAPPASCRPVRTPKASRTGATTNVIPQRQAGYVMAGITLPLGDLTTRAGARAGRHRPQVHRRHDADDRRSEHAAALGERGGPARRSTRR